MVLKFALLGSWHSHAGMHVAEAARHPDEFELLGMYDPDPEVIAGNHERFARYQLPVPVIASVAEVLSSEVDAVVIEGHIHQNLDYAEQALNAGKHVLLEKPAGVDLQHLQRVQELSVEQGLALQMAYMWRYNPAMFEILRLVRSGTLGQVFQYRGHIPKPQEWHVSLAGVYGRYAGGVYFEMAGHLIDFMVTVLGEPTAVRSVLGKHYGTRTEVDNAVVVHECANGIGIVDTTAMQAGMDRRVEVHGTAGTAIHAPLGSNNINLYLDEADGEYDAGWQEVEVEAIPDSPSLLHELAATIRGDKEPDYSLEHDMAVQRTLFTGCGIENGNAMKEAGA